MKKYLLLLFIACVPYPNLQAVDWKPKITRLISLPLSVKVEFEVYKIDGTDTTMIVGGQSIIVENYSATNAELKQALFAVVNQAKTYEQGCSILGKSTKIKFYF